MADITGRAVLEVNLIDQSTDRQPNCQLRARADDDHTHRMRRAELSKADEQPERAWGQRPDIASIQSDLLPSGIGDLPAKGWA